MTTYAIGDVQGCYQFLQALLARIQFNPQTDTLWFTGDLVNRGPQSLEVLRFVKQLGDKHIIILGNHDLHLIALYYGVAKSHRNDTLAAVLNAPDRAELIHWLVTRPLLHYDPTLNFVMTHAGLAPVWRLKDAQMYAQEVEAILREESSRRTFLQQMYDDTPDQWDDRLQGIKRWRCIVNYLTRMRLCHPDGRLALDYKGEIAGKPPDLLPWFEVPNRANADLRIIFGHWAALGGKATVKHIYPLDTGCVWGNCLTAMRLWDTRCYSIKCT